MSKKILITFFFLFVFASNIIPQTVGGSLLLGLPRGEFKDNVDRLGYGLQLHGTIWTPSHKLPFTIGANFSYMIYGEERERRPLSYYIPDVTVEVNRNNSLVNFHVLLQVAPFFGTVRPYFEGLFGGSYIFTSTSVESEWNDEEIFKSTNWSDYAWSYGGGGGLILLLNSSERNQIYLDLKARYLKGSEATYLTEDDVEINTTNGTVTYYPRKSETDVLSFHLGVVVYLF
ncbi:MAG: hypothetical protein JW866_11120 [Ignavibacteriales bacterium]|nr:hypothetical protein [Ignavibacteriales bacterium]